MIHLGKNMKKLQILKLLLAHHPLCVNFAPDMIGKKYPLCRGCIFYYPSFILTFLIGFFIQKIHVLIQMNFWIAIAIGVITLASFFFKVVISNMKQWFDDLIHVLTGFGASLIILTYVMNDFPIWIKIIIILDINLAMVIATFFHSKKMERICAGCEYVELGKNCPGWKDETDNPNISPENK